MRRSLLLFFLSLFAFQAEASSPGHGGSFGLVSGGELEHGTWGPGVKTDEGFSPIPNGPTPIFELTGTNGTSRLSRNLNLNSTTVAPTFLYEGKNASASGWTATVGDDATAAGSGGAFNQAAPLDGDLGVHGSGTRYYTTTAPSIGATESFVLELIVRNKRADNAIFERVLDAQDANGRFSLVATNSEAWQLALEDAGGNTQNLFAPVGSVGGFEHVVIAAERGGSLIGYNNFGTSGYGNFNIPGAIQPSTDLGILAIPGGTAPFTGDVVWAALWVGEDIVDLTTPGGRNEFTAWVRERFYALTGASAFDGTTPTTATRSSAGYLTKADTNGDNQLFLVSQNWPRVGSYNDGTTTRNAVQIEGSATNLLTYSEDFSNAAWTKNNLTGGASSTEHAPDPSKLAYEMELSIGAPATVFVRQAFSATNATQYAFSTYIKKGATAASGWGMLGITGSTTGTIRAWFNLNTGVVGTVQTGGTGYIESMGDGWHRVILIYTADATESINHQIHIVNGDNDPFINAGSVDPYMLIFGAQLETGSYATSYIPTTSASATRAPDALEYTLPALAPPYTVSVFARKLVSSFGGIVALSDGGTTNDRSLIADFGSGTYRFQAVSSGTTVANIPETSVTSGWQDMTAVTATDAFEFFVDGVSSGTDTSGTAPDNIDRLRLGAYQSGGNIRGGFIGLPLRIYDQVVEP